MKNRSLLHQPAEIFGYPVSNNSSTAQAYRNSYNCPFLGNRCIKESRVLPYPPAACSVWHKGNPMIICPQRFYQDNVIFKELASFVFGKDIKAAFLPEIKIPKFGTVDWVAFPLVDEKPLFDKFFGLEIQADSTTQTGKLNDAIRDFFSGKMQESYGYGLNTYNTLKLSFTQMMNKGQVFEYWQKPYVWAMQEPLYHDMVVRFGLHVHKDSDKSKRRIVFWVFRMRYNNEKDIYEFEHCETTYANVTDLTKAFSRTLGVSEESFKKSMSKNWEIPEKRKVII